MQHTYFFAPIKIPHGILMKQGFWFDSD